MRGQTPKDPNAMDIDMVMLRQQQRKRLSPQDLKKYWDKNLCFGCGQESYHRTDCLQKGNQKKKKILAAVQEVQEDQEELLGKRQKLGGVEGPSLSPNTGPPEATLWSAAARKEPLAAAAATLTTIHVAHIKVRSSLQIGGKEWVLQLIVDSGSAMDLISNSLVQRLSLPIE